MHIKLGDKVEAGKPLCTLFADYEGRFAEPEVLLRLALIVADEPASTEPLIQEIITSENRKEYLKTADRP